jgi:hypothetical protein
MEIGKGIVLSDSDEELAKFCLALMQRANWAKRQSQLARQQVEDKFGFDSTYGRLAQQLYDFAYKARRLAGSRSS